MVIERPAFLAAVVGWLRAGYPQGVPEQDYIPLLALLRRRVTDEEIGVIVGRLTAAGAGPFGVADIGVLITKVTQELPHPDDEQRVRDRLRAAGWDIERTSP